MSDIKVNEIKTDTIKNQAGTSALSINSAGVLTTGVKHAFYMYRSASQQINHATGFNLIQFDATAPNAPSVTSAETPTTNVRPTWTWSSGGGDGVGVYRVALDGEDITAADETTDLDFTPDSDLSAGTYTLYVQERDVYGNWSVSGSFAVEVTDS